ncbi:MAG: tRNA pseudouridine(38-40) synthase TruA [Wenzhouxiangella sp.]
MRLAAGVEYDGSAFYGWQRQRQSPTVQECLEDALSKVADRPVKVHCAGRTDTGVHAVCQVVHFDTPAERTQRSWVLGSNTHLPEGISVLWVQPVDEGFHARFSARRRRYRYRILNRWVRPAIDHRRVAWIRQPLAAARMHESAQALVGEHDFSSFRAVGCQASSPVRSIDRIAVERRDDEIVLEVRANAFVYHMVRNIAGTLIPIGSGERPVDWTASVLAARDRTVAGITAPAQGLYFLGPEYPEYPSLPIGHPVGFPRTA